MEVIILAGGLGTRLRSVVSELPKCMAPVGGKPFLWYLLENLRRFDVSRVILSVGYLREAVQDWVNENAGAYPWEFVFAVEEEPLGTGGGIKLAASLARGTDVVVLNGDTFFDADLEWLLEARCRSGLPIAVALKRMRDFDRYGAVEIGPESVIRQFREKDYCPEGLINGGIYALDLSSGILDGSGDKFSFEKALLEPACEDGKLFGLVQNAYFIDIGIPSDYALADSQPWLLHHPDTLLEIVKSVEGVDTLLLDRDGVLNRMLPGDYVKKISEFEWLPDVKEALALATRKFKHIFIVTNQRGVERGVMTLSDLDHVHSWMLDCISSSGGRIDGIYVCTALSDLDSRRKPNPGMFFDILRDYPDVEASRTIMIGDSPSDRQFAVNCGITAYIVR